jgi:hypothetical protein
MGTAIGNVVRETVEGAIVEGVAALAGADGATQVTPLETPRFSTGLATAPSALPRQALGLFAHLLVSPGTVAVVHLPGGERRVFEPGSYRLWNVAAGTILVQYVDARRQQIPVGPIEGWSADKWRVRLWLVVAVEVADAALIAAHRDPLGTLAAAVRTGALRYIEQHSHAELTGCAGEHGGLDAPAAVVAARLRDDPALEGLHVVGVRVLERQGDERQIEAATAATVAAAQIDEELRVAAARQRAQIHALESEAAVVEREHTLRMAGVAATAREALLRQQAEVQQATLAAELEIVLAQIRAQTAEIAHDEQIWQADQQRMQIEWERVQRQQLEAHQTGQQVHLLEAQHGLLRVEGEVALAAQERHNAHELALAEVQQRLAEQRTAQTHAIAERRAQHERTLLELHLRHEELVADQMQRLEQWRVQQGQASVQQVRQHERQMAVIAGTAQVAAAAAGQLPDGGAIADERHEVADAGLRTLQALAE